MQYIMLRKIFWTVFCGTLLLAAQNLSASLDIEKCNVVWNSPGKNASDSMPAGNGEVGINLWVEEGGDLQFYISRTDSWSEACRLLKLGKVRISLSPNPFLKGNFFVQKLNLKEGCIEISAGKKSEEIKIKTFVDANAPLVHIVGESRSPFEIAATLELWRTNKKILKGTELESSWTMKDAPENITVSESPDIIIDSFDNGIMWCHRNEDSIVPITLQHQGIESFSELVKDPIIHRTFGGVIIGKQFKKINNASIKTENPVKQFQIQVATLSLQTDTLLEWQNQITTIAVDNSNSKKALSRATEHWGKFWDKSWIFIKGDEKIVLPQNNHPLRIGCDSNGGSAFKGFISRFSLFDKPLNQNEIVQLSQKGFADSMPKPIGCWLPESIENKVVKNVCSTNLTGNLYGEIISTNIGGTNVWLFKNGRIEIPNNNLFQFKNGFTLEALINPDNASAAARIFDKLTAGVNDGFLLDTYPGKSLRFLVGDERIIAKDLLPESKWSHIAATYDTQSGEMRIYLNGNLIASNLSNNQNQQTNISLITRAYQLQRWISACAGSGTYPIKFNGSIFTVDPEYVGGPKLDPDWRRWGDCYWWQNTRLPYFPMLASGDFNSIQPLFDFYISNLPICKARAKFYYNADGVYFPETMTIFGTYANGDYGWNREGRKPNEVLSPWWRYAYQQGLELLTLMIDYYDYTLDKNFLNQKLVPMAQEVLLYFDTRFKRDENGKLVISPTQAVETYWYGVTNDTPTVAGLNSVVNRLDKIKELLLPDIRALVAKMKSSLPEIPVATQGNVSFILPAKYFEPKRSNIENPELYAIWPFRLFTIGKENVEIGMETYSRRFEKSMIGWSYDGQCAAILGLTDEAKKQILFKVRNSNRNFRFPAMWGPNYDWLPDQDHGSNIMLTLQNMLIFDDGEKIHLFPAFPKEWDVKFKLRASKNTTVECEYQNGKINKLKVTPISRRNDIVLHLN